MLLKIRIICVVISILVILLIGNLFFLNILIYNKHLICNGNNIPLIKIIHTSKYNYDNNELFEYLKFSKAEFIIYLNCDENTNSPVPYVHCVGMDNIKSLFNEDYTALNIKNWQYYLDTISYNNTTIPYSSTVYVNYSGQLDNFSFNLKSGLMDNMDKVANSIVIVVDEPNHITLNNHKVLGEVVFANGFYTLLFNNFLSYTTTVALIIAFMIFWLIRLAINMNSNSTKKNILIDLLYLIGLGITSYILLSLGLLIDYLLIIILISLSIIIEHSITYINRQNKSFN